MFDVHSVHPFVIPYIAKRLLFMVPLLLLISAFAFVIVRVAPGGPFDKERKLPIEIERNIKAKYHLDWPMWRQYAAYLGDLVRGDLGLSLKYRNRTVNEIVAQALPVSIALGSLAFFFALGVGIPLGAYAAARQNQMADYTATLLALTGVSLPSFVIAPLLILIFAIKLGLLPVALWESLRHAVLPCVALSAYFIAKIMRLTREGMIGALQQEFIVAARAKGLPEAVVIGKHALKLGLLPVVSYLGPMLADLFTGSFVVESICQVPGLGTFVVNGSLNRDYTMVVGLVIVYAALLLLLNLIVDVGYHFLDRRIKLHDS
jgi:oligopeptide transport system permease protein